WIETPYRNQQVFETALAVLAPQTRLTVASQLTLRDETVATRRIYDWRQAPPAIPREPTVFAMLAERGQARAPAPGHARGAAKADRPGAGRPVSEATSGKPRRP